MKQYLDIKVSTFKDVRAMADKEPQPLRAILTSGEYKERVEAVRAVEYHSSEQKELKRSYLYLRWEFSPRRGEPIK